MSCIPPAFTTFLPRIMAFFTIASRPHPRLLATAAWVACLPAATGMDNVALGRPATSNDVYLSYAASRAVDGDPDTQWTASSHGSPEAPRWIRIDLGHIYSLERVQLLFGYSNGQYEGYTNTFTLHTSEDDVTWTGAGEGTLVDTASLQQRSRTILLPGPDHRARYLRYEVTGGSHWAQLFELQAFSPGTTHHSLAAEWTDGANPMPGSQWSVRSGDLPLLPIDNLADTRIDTWDGPQPGFTALGLDPINDVIPCWFKASSTFTGVASPTDWVAGDIVVHSGRAYHPPTRVGWRSPSDGVLTITGSVWPVREIGRHNFWQLQLDHSPLTSGVVGSGDPYSRAQPFPFTSGSAGADAVRDVPVTAGQELRLTLAPADGGVPDYTALDLSVAVTPAPAGHVFDFERDFSTARNGNREAWSYRSATGRGGPYPLLPFFHATGHEAAGFPAFPAWHAVDDPDAIPHVGVNIFPYPLASTSGIMIAPGQSHLHPGRDGEVSVVSFRAPRPGTLLIECAFTDLDAGGGDGIVWWVDHENGSPLASGTLANGGTTGPLLLPPVFARAGERIHFALSAGTSPSNDTTRLSARVQLVPAPAPENTLNFDGPYTNGTLLDSRGLAWSGTGDFTVSAVPSKWGSVGTFDGDGDTLRPSTPTATFDPGAAPFTVDFWMHPQRDGRQDYLLGNSRPDSGQGWDLRLDYGEILVTGINGWRVNIGTENVDDTRFIETGRWHHIALSCTESTARLFIDGTLRAEVERGTIGASPNPFRIGGQENFGGRGFQGSLDEVRFWKSAVWTASFTPPSRPGLEDTVLAAALPEVHLESRPGEGLLRWPTRQGLEYAVEAGTDLRTWRTERPFARPAGPEESITFPIDPLSTRHSFRRVAIRTAAP